MSAHASDEHEPDADIDSTSDVDAAARWIRLVPPRRYFTPAGVPGDIDSAQEAIANLLEAEPPLIVKMMEGVYARQPDGHENSYRRVEFDSHRAARVLLPAGSGLAGSSALEAVGWIHQGVIRPSFAVLDESCELPPFPHRQPKLVLCPNQRRRELSWHEVTILEAFQHHGRREPRIPSAKSLADRLTEILLSRGGGPLLVRRHKLAWALETEPGVRHDTRRMRRERRQVLRRLPKHWEDIDRLGEMAQLLAWNPT